MGNVLFEKIESRALVTLDHPRKLNALDITMLQQLHDIFEQCDTDSTIRTVILTGSGMKAFCSGADINCWSELSPTEFSREWILKGHRLFDRIACLGKPTIAVLNGLALGGGLELAATCDIRIAAPHANLGLPEAQIGVIPGWSGTQRLARLIPEPVLKEMVLFGRRISATRSFEIGFTAEIADDPLTRAVEVSQKMDRLSPQANAISKAMIHAGVGEAGGAMIEAIAGLAIAGTSDMKEGVSAFKEKRDPNFTTNK